MVSSLLGVEPSDYASPEAVVAALRSGDARALLFRYCVFLTGSEVDGEELLADAVAMLCDAVDGRPWDTKKHRFVPHMRLVLHDLARQQRRRARARREQVVDGLALEEGNIDSIGEGIVDGAPPPDAALGDARQAARLHDLGERLRQRLAGSALAVFDAMAQGLGSVPELTAHLGLAAEEIYRARESVAYHAKAVLAEERHEEERRMAGRKGEPIGRARATPVGPT